jgi:hypothetical protein
MNMPINISAEHPAINLLDLWINVEETQNATSPSYCHLLIHQNDDIPQEVWDELFNYIDHAHAGAREALRAPLGDSLHPLQHNTEVDPAFGYPHRLGDTALKGFFGEIMAGILAENYASDGEYNWNVPVYLFRTHLVAFQQLEVMKQTDDWERQIVGRTGDDGLAFARDENGHIVAWLACEAKCTGNHSSTLVNDNHKKLSLAVNRPVDLLRTIDALSDYDNDDYRRDWITALRNFYWEDAQNSAIERSDFSMYVCGTSPQRKRSWISINIPNKHYTGGRNLSCAEFHLDGVDDIIRSLYGRMDDTS